MSREHEKWVITLCSLRNNNNLFSIHRDYWSSPDESEPDSPSVQNGGICPTVPASSVLHLTQIEHLSTPPIHTHTHTHTSAHCVIYTHTQTKHNQTASNHYSVFLPVDWSSSDLFHAVTGPCDHVNVCSCKRERASVASPSRREQVQSGVSAWWISLLLDGRQEQFIFFIWPWAYEQ